MYTEPDYGPSLQSSPQERWSLEERRLAKRAGAAATRTKEDFLELEARNSEKEVYQLFLAPYLETTNSCLVIGTGWAVVERRWIQPFQTSGRRLLLTDVNDVILEPVARLYGAETMQVDALNMPPHLFASFHLVYAILVEYQFEDDEYRTMLSNMRRCLKEGLPGTIVLLVVTNIQARTIMNSLRLAYRLSDLDRRLPPWALALLGRRRTLSKFTGWERSMGTHRTLLQRAGLEVIKVVPLFDDGSFWGWFSKVGNSKAVGIVAVPVR